MNSIYRNFIITLKVNKMAATLNICGLVIAFTLFDSVAIRTESERTFDKIHSKAEAIYRLDCVTSKSQWPTQILPFAQAFASSSPHILEYDHKSLRRGSLFYDQEGRDSQRL